MILRCRGSFCRSKRSAWPSLPYCVLDCGHLGEVFQAGRLEVQRPRPPSKPTNILYFSISLSSRRRRPRPSARRVSERIKVRGRMSRSRSWLIRPRRRPGMWWPHGRPASRRKVGSGGISPRSSAPGRHFTICSGTFRRRQRARQTTCRERTAWVVSISPLSIKRKRSRRDALNVRVKIHIAGYG
jgi:hypothetical protein